MLGFRPAGLAGAVAGVLVVMATPLPAQRSVQVSGLLYTGWFLDMGPGAEGDNRFEVTRAYVNLAGRTSERISGRLTTDAIRENNRELEIRLSFAFVQYQAPGSPIAIRFGLTGTPLIPLEEALWDYRMHGPMPADRGRYLGGADLGIVVDGRWGAGEQVQVTAGVYNGEGRGHGSTGAGKDVMARVTVRLAGEAESGPLGGLRLTAYGHLGRPKGAGDRHRALGMLSWHEGSLTLGLQGMLARDGLRTAEAPPAEAILVNAFGLYRIPGSPVVVLGRVHRLDPDRNTPGDAALTALGGVSYQVAPELRLLGSFEATSYQGAAPTPVLEAARRQLRLQMMMVF